MSDPTPARGTIPRAARFALALPLRFRRTSEPVWRDGRIENISRTGILFRCDAPLDVGEAIELTFALRAVNADRPSATVVCEAQVTRTEARPASEEPRALAAAITHYRLVPREEASSTN